MYTSISVSFLWLFFFYKTDKTAKVKHELYSCVVLLSKKEKKNSLIMNVLCVFGNFCYFFFYIFTCSPFPVTTLYSLYSCLFSIVYDWSLPTWDSLEKTQQKNFFFFFGMNFSGWYKCDIWSQAKNWIRKKIEQKIMNRNI